MSKRRPSGDGMVRKREDGRWEGRIVIGHKANSDSIFRYICADTQKELTANITFRGARGRTPCCKNQSEVRGQGRSQTPCRHKG